MTKIEEELKVQILKLQAKVLQLEEKIERISK